MNTPAPPPLIELAHAYGIETAYYDIFGHHQVASTEALLAILRSLGAPLATLADVPAAKREYQQAQWQRHIEPVLVAWDGGPLPVEIRLPAKDADAGLTARLKLDSGEEQEWSWPGADLPGLESADIEGTTYTTKRISLPAVIPDGYHRLTVEFPGGTAESLVISAPTRAFNDKPPRNWGVFLPLYAFHLKDGVTGHYPDLEKMMAWMANMGGNVLGTLPLLASFLDEQFNPSPYSPASRLFWNEFYIDVNSTPEWANCPSARALQASAPVRDELDRLRQAPLIDYQRLMGIKRRILEELCACCFADDFRLQALQRFVCNNDFTDSYARFRATSERQRLPWSQWPQRLRDGNLDEGDYDDAARRYHIYVQWLSHEQLQAVSRKSQELGVELYLDLPLGVHPDSFDVWRWREIFATEVSSGAPPDDFFIKGQDWGSPPLHPEKLRQTGYQYFIACVRNFLAHAGTLRIDHVMQFHHLFWVPKGMEARQGVYVRYHPEEFYAILSLESHRHRSMIVGENLGTVPPEVTPTMRKHGLLGMYELQFQVTPDPKKALNPVPAETVASLNTHDMPPFAAFWNELDILDRQELGLLDAAGVEKERERRRTLKKALVGYLFPDSTGEPALEEVLRAVLDYLGASPARTILVNLEDLWQEPKPQNTPGTWLERPNWLRKARYSFEDFREMPQVIAILSEINRLRKESILTPQG
ncbi:MAG: 4-alpha-glucanotransferase [Dehalococcoidales bacterium]|nr:4-alpha-glucanotransferase [Dehalococcoidales bacterium]